MKEIKKTTLHPDNQPNVDLYPKTSADQVESLDARIKALSTHIYTVSINLPKGAKNGNITQSQLDILQASEFSCIEMVNDKELYYLNDTGHVEGFLTYSHVGIENSKTTIKTLTITVSAKSFVIVTTVVPTESGGKLYRHDVKIKNITEGSAEYFKMSFLSTSESKTTDINQIVDQDDFKSIVGIVGYIQIVKFSGAPDCFPLSFTFGNFEGVIYSEGAASLYKTYYESFSVANAGSGAPANIIHTDTVTEL